MKKDDIFTRRRTVMEQLIQRRTTAADKFFDTAGTPYGMVEVKGQRLRNLYAVSNPQEKATIWGQATPEDQQMLREVYQQDQSGSTVP